MFRLKFVWGFPVLVINWSWDKWAHQLLLFVFIPKEAKDYDVVMAHELWHVKQSILTLFLMNYIGAVSKKFRYRIEASAYGESVRKGGDIKRYAKALSSSNYGLNITEEEAEAFIKEYVTSCKFI